jgi:hypothetical protein
MEESVIICHEDSCEGCTARDYCAETDAEIT